MKSYPKKSKDATSRASNPRKRRFHGNQFTEKKGETVGQSASARKLSSSRNEDIHWNPLHTYRFIEFFTVFTALSNLVICCECKETVKFEEAGNRGLGFKLVLLCRCGRRNINSGPLINTGYEVNRRIVFVMRLLGIGREGINLFCNLMDICDGLSESSYNKIIEHIYSATKSVFEFCSKKAVDEEKKENNKHERSTLNLKVSGDGSWKKRGFKSLYGVTTLIGYYSGKVIDLIVKSSYCQGCTFWKKKQNTQEYREWYEEHEEECTKNHEGSAGKMEVDAVTEMFLRSDEKFGVKYGNYIGDGDSKTFKAILDVNPYGNFQIIKSECIGHVEKRMGTRLRNVKKATKLGGKGKLTDALIKKLTSYYGLAIRRNINNVEDMKKAIMATYYHMCSTNENPKHEFCPPGADSWCKWQKAQVIEANFEHPTPLHPDVQKHILPIYEDLSQEDLLQRCLGGHTQNANESFNSTVWRFAPKHLHSGLKIVQIAAYMAAGLFNEGYTSILQIMNRLEIIIGKQSKTYADNIDKHRVIRQERCSSLATKEARKARRQQLLEEKEMYEETEGLLYGPGIAN